MFLDQIQFLYVIFSILIHDLIRVLKILCGQHSHFYHTVTYQLNKFINFHFFLLEMEDQYENHEAL